MKALTFSYDDGVTTDRRLIEIFDRYDCKATFNLNSGLMEQGKGWNEWQRGLWVEYNDRRDIRDIYRGHEVAGHTLNHPTLCQLSDEEIRREIAEDKAQLERLTGREVVGMAWPYGSYDDRVLRIAADCGMCYSRTVQDLHAFELPFSKLTWAMTCHHNDERLFEFAQRFLEMEPDRPQLFSVWGHSYEFDVDENWDRIERLCEMLAGRDDIFYATNREALGI